MAPPGSLGGAFTPCAVSPVGRTQVYSPTSLLPWSAGEDSVIEMGFAPPSHQSEGGRIAFWGKDDIHNEVLS